MVVKKQKQGVKKQKQPVAKKAPSTQKKKKTPKIASSKEASILVPKIPVSLPITPIAVSFKRSLFSFPYWSSGLIFFSVVLLCIKAVLLWRGGFVDVGGFANIMKRYIGWLGNDLLYCLLVWLIGHIAMRIRFAPIKTLCVLSMGILLYIYGADIFAMTNFHSRFVLSGTGFFSWENAGPYLRYGISATVMRLLGAYISVAVMFFVAKYANQRRGFHLLRIGVAIAVCLLGVSFFVAQISSYQQNVFQLSRGADSRSKHTNDKTYEQYYKKFTGLNAKPDIIVVFAESFSSIDSEYAGGSQNLLSGFDTIARDGTFYTNFISNGCTSDSAHIALLQGIEPWETDNTQQEYTRYKSYALGLPAYLATQGYSSTFVSTAPLGFLNQKDFLVGLQFDTIIGNEAFTKQKKYVFRAAPDQALYQQAQKVLLEPHTKPQFVVLETISSHKPYDTPLGNDEVSAFRYSDGQLLEFYRQLQSMHYFDHGILVVVGDHRKMQAMGYDEIERRGKAAYGKAVLAIVGKDIPAGVIAKKPLQHWDLFSSLKRLTTSGGVILHQYYNDAFAPYQGRDAAIRYCQFVDRQYVASRQDGTSRTITPTQRNDYAAYIRSYYEFQQGKKYNTGDMSSGVTVPVTYPGLIRIAHQGYTVQSPPNSFDAYKAAKSVGAEGIEMDISFTRDGYPIVMHGPQIGRTKCTKAIGKKLISDFDLQEMKDTCTLYNGQPILTLQEMLEKTQNMFQWYFVDIKVNFNDQRKYIGPMLKSIKALGLEEKIMFSSTDADVNYELGSTRGIIAGWEVFDPITLEEPLQSNVPFILIPENIANPEVVTQIIAARKQPIVYTVNTSTSLRQLYDWGVRFILTDKPTEIAK